MSLISNPNMLDTRNPAGATDDLAMSAGLYTVTRAAEVWNVPKLNVIRLIANGTLNAKVFGSAPDNAPLFAGSDAAIVEPSRYRIPKLDFDGFVSGYTPMLKARPVDLYWFADGNADGAAQRFANAITTAATRQTDFSYEQATAVFADAGVAIEPTGAGNFLSCDLEFTSALKNVADQKAGSFGTLGNAFVIVKLRESALWVLRNASTNKGIAPLGALYGSIAVYREITKRAMDRLKTLPALSFTRTYTYRVDPRKLNQYDATPEQKPTPNLAISWTLGIDNLLSGVSDARFIACTF